MEGGFQEKSVDWPSCDYSRGRNLWLFVTGTVCVAARKVVVLREQNADSSLVVEPLLSYCAKKN